MALKIITGCLVPDDDKRTGGTATILFYPQYTVRQGGDATVQETEVIGARGRFTERPGKMVSMRDFTIQDRRKWSEDKSASDRFSIYDKDWTSDSLTVERVGGKNGQRPGSGLDFRSS
jgi:hypothetical protein